MASAASNGALCAGGVRRSRGLLDPKIFRKTRSRWRGCGRFTQRRRLMVELFALAFKPQSAAVGRLYVVSRLYRRLFSRAVYEHLR